MSSRITIDNRTDVTWTRVGDKDNKTWGAWDGDDQPPIEVGPKSKMDVKATGKFMSGSKYVIYFATKDGGEVELYCNNPGWSSNESSAKMTKGTDTYSAFLEGSNSGSDMHQTLILKKKE